MTNAERNLIKKKILKCLTENFEGNKPIFMAKEKYEFCDEPTKLTVIMDAIIKGLQFAQAEINDMAKGLK